MDAQAPPLPDRAALRVPTLLAPPEPAPSPRLLDERSSPDFRDVFGRLAARASRIDVAVTRIRIGGIDLSPAELGGAERIRVLLAEVSALRLAAEAEAILADGRRARNVSLMLRLLQEGRLRIRSAPLGGWSPDFTVFFRAADPWAVLVGPHWFERPYPHRGPALASLHGPADARRAATRFGELWHQGHDIGAAVRGVLEDVCARSPFAERGEAEGS